MIIKVPIYLEFDSLDPNAVQFVVEEMNVKFTRILRKEKFAKLSFKILDTDIEHEFGPFKIKTKEQALDYLRTVK
jgi:hypothetical protein